MEGAEPAVPQAPLPPNEEIAVFVWRAGRVAAILSISNEPDDDEETYSQDINVFELDEGVWWWRNSGGTDWPTEYGVRPSMSTPALTGLGVGAPSPDGIGSVWLISGIAPPDVERVRVEGREQVAETDVEPVTGAFLVAMPEHAIRATAVRRPPRDAGPASTR